jgi:RHS repeat-associated protein
VLYNYKPLYIAVGEASAATPNSYTNLLYSTMSNGSINFTFTPTQTNVELSIKEAALTPSIFATSHLCFTIDSVNYTQQNGSTSSTQLVQISSKQSDKYRFGYGGHEKDDEIKGSGNHLSFGDYGYDPGTGRRWNIDPKFNEIAGISPYTYALDNPVVYVDKDGKLPIVPLLLKAGAAGAADMLAQAAMAYYFDPKVESTGQAFEVVNWWQVSRSAAEGLIPWRTPGGRIGKAVATASGDVLVNALDAGFNYTQEQALKDFATGFIGDLAGGGLGDLVSKYGAKGVANGLLKMGFDTKYIRQATGGLSNNEVRSWYSDQVKKIDINLNPTEANARMVVNQRNSLKQKARDLMSDRKLAADLSVSDPIQDFDYYNKKYSGDYSKIMKGGTTPNADVNKKLGVK